MLTLSFSYARRCGASYDEKLPSLVDATVTEEVEKSKPKGGQVS